tara:strand:+ start:130 stop:414 length:285 start_codon:yes stop_codon:yes gene_type:complete
LSWPTHKTWLHKNKKVSAGKFCLLSLPHTGSHPPSHRPLLIYYNIKLIIMISIYLIKRYNISSTPDKVKAIIAGTCLSAPIVIPTFLVLTGVIV